VSRIFMDLRRSNFCVLPVPLDFTAQPPANRLTCGSGIGKARDALMSLSIALVRKDLLRGA
jgi:hypothetical protein